MTKEKCFKVADYICEYSLYGLIFFIPISKAAIEVFFTYALFAFYVKKILRPDFKFLRNWPHFLLLLFIGFSALSLVNSGPYLLKSFKAIFFKWSEYLFIFIITVDTLSNRKRIRNGMIIFLAGSALIGMDGIFQRINGVDFLRHRDFIRMELSGITASFEHYNAFGAYLLIPISLVAALLISKRLKQAHQWPLLALGMLLTACIVFTNSRGSWIGLISSVVLLLALTKRLKWLALLFLIFIIAFNSLPQLKSRVMHTFQPQGDSDRLMVWRVSAGLIKQNPFLGKGAGTFMDYLHKYAPTLVVQYAHNCFLQIWVETGIFSLLSFLGFLFFLLLQGIKAFFRRQDPLILGLLCGALGFLVHSFFDTQFYSLQLSALFWSMAGLLYSLIRLP